MDLWEPRRATSLKEARARTALVHILRLLFTIGAVLSAGILMGTLVQSVFRSAATPADPGRPAPPCSIRASKGWTPATGPIR